MRDARSARAVSWALSLQQFKRERTPAEHRKAADQLEPQQKRMRHQEARARLQLALRGVELRPKDVAAALEAEQMVDVLFETEELCGSAQDEVRQDALRDPRPCRPRGSFLAPSLSRRSFLIEPRVISYHRPYSASRASQSQRKKAPFLFFFSQESKPQTGRGELKISM